MEASLNYDLVRATPFAAELTDKECMQLAAIIKTRHLEDNELLIQEGRIDNALHVVTQGRLAVIKSVDDDEEELLHILKSGEIAGAMGFVDGTEHSASLRSIGECEIFTLERDKLESLITTHPMIVYRVMRAVIRSVHTIVRRMNNQYIQMTNYITKQRGKY